MEQSRWTGAGASQRVGGVASLVAAGTFVFGFALFGTVLADYTADDLDPAGSVEFVVDHQGPLFVWHVVIFVLFGIALIPVALAWLDRLRPEAAVIATPAAALGIIWSTLVIAAGMIANLGIGAIADLHEVEPASAEPVWSTLEVVQDGLGGGNEIVGGLWVLLIGCAAWRTASLPRGASILAVVAGGAGILTVIPALEAFGAVFGLGLIVWFTWSGIVLLRTAEGTAGPGDRDDLVVGGAATAAAVR